MNPAERAASLFAQAVAEAAHLWPDHGAGHTAAAGPR